MSFIIIDLLLGVIAIVTTLIIKKRKSKISEDKKLRKKLKKQAKKERKKEEKETGMTRSMRKSLKKWGDA